MTVSAISQPALSGEAAKRHYEAALREYPAQAIVDLQALRDNMRTLVNRVHAKRPQAAVMGVVKADAYGHGLIPAALAALAGGATWLGTAQPHEAIALRDAGIDAHQAHILTWVFNAQEAPFMELMKRDIDISIGSLSALQVVCRAAQQVQRAARVHIKVDTGFGRNGMSLSEFDEFIYALQQAVSHNLVCVVGLWSHLAVADAVGEAALAHTNEQVTQFYEFERRLEQVGLRPEIRHIANTAATLNRPDLYFELVRPGIGFYGYEPDPAFGAPEEFGLQPAMTLQAQLSTVKPLSAGHGISYGRTYITSEPTTTAIVPIGYADGIHRAASGSNALGELGVEKLGGPVRARTSQGVRVFHASGRICMDQFMIDLHSADAAALGVHEGDTVELFGPGRGEHYGEPTADDWARAAGTISYEIFTCLGTRIPRLYAHAREVLSETALAMLDPATLL